MIGWRQEIINRARDVARAVDRLPVQWSRRVQRRYARMLGEQNFSDIGAENKRRFSANRWRYDILTRAAAVKIPMDASDGDIRDIAERRAGECWSRAMVIHDKKILRREMAAHCARSGIVAPDADDFDDTGAIARMVDPLWWRRKLREYQGRAIEAMAIELGYVHAKREIYASDVAVNRRRSQLRRNRTMLENTTATNENGDEFTLAELAARSVANPSIRRGELMTRIRGFEEIAAGVGDVAEFVTITCPSRMHARIRATGYRNGNYDNTTPKAANNYLARVWARIRAQLARVGISPYGFRVVEPHHDGCPHWHLLLFFRPEISPGRGARARFRAIVRRYALADSRTEQGAREYRCKFVEIDAGKGGAAGYIAKYISKNIDGYGVEDDLFGNPAIEASARIGAWAATWRIRQFQQIGGAPVTLWRELRRMRETDSPRVEAARVAADAGDWAAYLRAMGGAVRARATQFLRVAREWSDKAGRYGDAVGERICGVLDMFSGRVFKSERHEWEVKRARSVRTRTRVNNYTGTIERGDDGRKHNTGSELDGAHSGDGAQHSRGIGSSAFAGTGESYGAEILSNHVNDGGGNRKSKPWFVVGACGQA